jgi:cellulase (glycosyl hydrolase family 5)
VDCGQLTRIARCTLAIGVLALAFTATTASAGRLQTGFLDPAAAARGDQFEIIPAGTAMQAVEGAGGSIVRLYLYWRSVAGPIPPEDPTNPSSYNWNARDLQANVEAAQNNGLQVMLTIRSAPDWAQRGGHDSRGTHNPDPDKLRDFTRAAVDQFSTVQYWGIWNEPNYKTFLSPQYRHGKLVSPGMYRQLLNSAAGVLHNHGKTVIAGETAPFSHWDSKGRPTAPGPLLFLRKLLCVDGAGHSTCKTNVRADIFSTHPYTSGDAYHHAFNPNDVSFGDLPQWKALINAASKAKHITNRSGGHRAALWISEFSWDSKPIDPRAVPSELHARWTAEALYRTWKLGIDVLLWGQLRDYEISTDKFFGQYQSGLYYCDDTPTLEDSCPSYMAPDAGPGGTAKPSLRAFRFPFVAYASRGRIQIWGRTPDSMSQQVTIQKNTSSGWANWKVFTAGSGGIFSKTYTSSMKTGKLRAVVTGDESVGFSLVRPKDRFVNPFGCGGVIPC